MEMGLRPKELYELVVLYKKQKKKLLLIRQFYGGIEKIPVEVLDYVYNQDRAVYVRANDKSKKEEGPSYIFFKPKDRNERKILETLYA